MSTLSSWGVRVLRYKYTIYNMGSFTYYVITKGEGGGFGMKGGGGLETDKK